MAAGVLAADDRLLTDETMRTPSSPLWHRPVMSTEVLQHLDPRPGQIVVDGTVGTGGHSLLLLPRLLPHGRLIAVDRDPDALEAARARLREFGPNVIWSRGNYRNLPSMLRDLGIPRVDALLLDLGMSSVQVDRPERGFSFAQEGPLDMRMDPSEEMTAAVLVNRSTQQELATILSAFGEERFAHRIARRIVQERLRQPMTTTAQVARLVVASYPPNARRGRLHPATRTFQALRIAVNDELRALEELLGCLHTILQPGGRAVIVTFHSLEDRLVKRAFVQGAAARQWTVLTRKPVRPSAEEIRDNPRARSAKLRAVVCAARSPAGMP